MLWISTPHPPPLFPPNTNIQVLEKWLVGCHATIVSKAQVITKHDYIIMLIWKPVLFTVEANTAITQSHTKGHVNWEGALLFQALVIFVSHTMHKKKKKILVFILGQLVCDTLQRTNLHSHVQPALFSSFTQVLFHLYDFLLPDIMILKDNKIFSI